MRPLMNIESYKWTLLRPMPLAQLCVSLALLSATASPALSFSQGTPEQRLACTPDVLRLCSAFIHNADEITICLREKNAELSDACRTAVEAGMKQLTSVSDWTGARQTHPKIKIRQMNVHQNEVVVVDHHAPAQSPGFAEPFPPLG